jgi:enoyl-CoA hydratase/carnithine racemase
MKKNKITRKPQTSKACFKIFKHRLSRVGREICVIEAVFSNPDSRNALSLSAARELSKLVKNAGGCDGLLVRAEGPVFCAGGNIKDHIAMGSVASKKGNREIAKACEQLAAIEVPTIALVEGDALGGGVEFLSCFDIVFATPHVLVAFWQRRLGLTYGWGGGARLERRIGRAAVSRHLIQASTMTGKEAVRLGLIDRTVAPWLIRSEGLAELFRIASLPKASVSVVKRNSRRSSGGPENRSGFEKLWYGSEHLNRMNAFAKR